MNDFTKEELKFISIALERFAVKDVELSSKIKSLIDSHCEHEFVGYLEGVAAIPYCRKCQRAIFNDN